LPVDICGVASLRSGTVEGDLGYLGDFLRVSRPCFQNLNLLVNIRRVDPVTLLAGSARPRQLSQKVPEGAILHELLVLEEVGEVGDGGRQLDVAYVSGGLLLHQRLKVLETSTETRIVQTSHECLELELGSLHR